MNCLLMAHLTGLLNSKSLRSLGIRASYNTDYWHLKFPIWNWRPAVMCQLTICYQFPASFNVQQQSICPAHSDESKIRMIFWLYTLFWPVHWLYPGINKAVSRSVLLQNIKMLTMRKSMNGSPIFFMGQQRASVLSLWCYPCMALMVPTSSGRSATNSLTYH